MADLVSAETQWWENPAAAETAAAAALLVPAHRERWKYTPASKVVALLASADPAPEEPAVTELVSVTEQLSSHDVLAYSPEAAGFLARQGKVRILRLDANAEVHSLPQDGIPTLIQVNEGVHCELHCLAEHSQQTSIQQMLWIQLGPGAHLTHCNNFLDDVAQWQYVHVQVRGNAHYRQHNHSQGSSLHRQDTQIRLIEPGAEASLFSSAVVGQRAHFDQQVRMEHCAPHTRSEQAFHTLALADAKVTFNGRIHIHEGCDGSNAQLSNKNVALEKTATINTKPELEIYADDVQCSHGATVGQLDEVHEFYCASRGIPPAAARKLLCRAFLSGTTSGAGAEPAMRKYAELLT